MTISIQHLNSLKDWAAKIEQQETDHHLYTEPEGTGIEIVFDGICEWSYDVKVKLPRTFFGKQTREVFLIFQKELRVPLATSSLAESLLASKPGSSLDGVSDHVRVFNYDLEYPEYIGWTIGEDEGPPDFEFSKFSWDDQAPEFQRRQSGSFVCRYIEGFEGSERDLKYIHRRKHFSGDEQDATLDTVIATNILSIAIDGVPLDDSLTKDFLIAATDVLPSYWL